MTNERANTPQEENDVMPPLETIGTDIPLGKTIRMGIRDYTIYESAIEQGYQAGIQAHREYLRDHNSTTPVILDDVQFTLVIEHFMPGNLTPFNQGLWRSHFIVGWTCVYLDLDGPHVFHR
jgi:hypothetical protein